MGSTNTRLLTDLLIMEVPQNENSSTLHRITIRRIYDYGQKHGFEAAFKDIRNSIMRSKMPMWIGS